MSLTQEKKNFSKANIKKIVIHMLSAKYSITSEEAFRRFMLTDTYALLDSDASMLWVESPEYVFDMYDAEINNDVERWLEI